MAKTMTESDFKRIAVVIGPVSGATHEALREYFVNGNIKATAAKLAGIKPSTMTIYVGKWETALFYLSQVDWQQIKIPMLSKK